MTPHQQNTTLQGILKTRGADIEEEVFESWGDYLASKSRREK